MIEISPVSYVDILSGLPSRAVQEIFKRLGYKGPSDFEAFTDFFLRKLESGRARKLMPSESLPLLDLLVAYGGVLDRHLVTKGYLRGCQNRLKELQSLGLVAESERGDIFLAREILFHRQLGPPFQRCLLWFLRELPENAVHGFYAYWKLRPECRSSIKKRSDLWNFLDRNRKRFLNELSETAQRLLKMAEEHPLLPDADPGPEGNELFDFTAAVICGEASVEPEIHELLMRGLLIPGQIKHHLEAYALVVPSEARKDLPLWFAKKSIPELLKKAIPKEAKPKILLQPGFLFEHAKKVLIELLYRPVRVTSDGTPHKTDTRLLAKRFSTLPFSAFRAAFNFLRSLQLIDRKLIGEADQGVCFRPTARGEIFLKLQGEDREKYLWALCHQQLNVGSLNDEFIVPYIDFPPWTPSDILKVLPEHEFIPVQETADVFCRPDFELDLFEELFVHIVELLFALGWVNLTRWKGRLYMGLSERGREIRRSPAEMPEPPEPSRAPLIVESSGKVIAAPDTPLSVLEILAALGEPLSVDPMYCFRLDPKRIRSALAENLIPEGLTAFFERHCSVPLPAGIKRLLEDVKSSIPVVALIKTGGVIECTDEQAAKQIAKEPKIGRYVGAQRNRYLFLRPAVDLRRVHDALRRNGIKITRDPNHEQAIVAARTADHPRPKEIISLLREAIQESKRVTVRYRRETADAQVVTTELDVVDLRPKTFVGLDKTSRMCRIKYSQVLSLSFSNDSS